MLTCCTSHSLASDPAALAGISGRGSNSDPAQRGVLILPGLGNNAADYTKLAGLLQEKGMAVQVAQVERIDWSRNAAALTYGELSLAMWYFVFACKLWSSGREQEARVCTLSTY
jgi:NAD(P)H-hydrate repair Nnr-like enzyme with NAD(P)H-hydrate epimerase domain